VFVRRKPLGLVELGSCVTKPYDTMRLYMPTEHRCGGAMHAPVKSPDDRARTLLLYTYDRPRPTRSVHRPQWPCHKRGKEGVGKGLNHQNNLGAHPCDWPFSAKLELHDRAERPRQT
jgi:hypothetical protein